MEHRKTFGRFHSRARPPSRAGWPAVLVPNRGPAGRPLFGRQRYARRIANLPLFYLEHCVNKRVLSDSEAPHACSLSTPHPGPLKPHHRVRCPRMVDASQTMSSKRLDTIADYWRHGFALRVDCLTCRRVALLNPLGILLLCQKRGWSKQMAAVESRLKCTRCSSRHIRTGPAFGD